MQHPANTLRENPEYVQCSPLTVGDNKKLTLRFVARSFCSACVIVLAPSSHTVAPSRDRFNVCVIVFTKRNN